MLQQIAEQVGFCYDQVGDLLQQVAMGGSSTSGCSTDAGIEALLAGTVNGYVPAVLARGLAGCSSTWTRLFESPETGSMLAVDAYRPTEAMKRLIRARDEHCRFPGCRVPAKHCEIDHSLAWADGGRTTHDNLALLCKKHHRLKHASGWKIEHLGGGRLRWTSPLGHRYPTEPETAVGFVEAPGGTTADSADATGAEATGPEATAPDAAVPKATGPDAAVPNAGNARENPPPY